MIGRVPHRLPIETGQKRLGALVVVSGSSKLAGVPKTQDLKETKIKTKNERRNWENEKKMVPTQIKSAPLKKET